MRQSHHPYEIQLELDAPGVGLTWPVTSGVPLPAGKLFPDQPVSLAGLSGCTLPCQTRPLVLWPDGSVKWLSVTAPMELGSGQKRYVLRSAASQQEEPVGQEASAGGGEGGDLAERVLYAVSVASDEMSLSLPHRRPWIIENVRHRDRQIIARGFESTVVETDGTVHRQGPPDIVRIERNGPVHTRISISGEYEGSRYGFGYAYRLDFFAGASVIRIEHTVVNRASDRSEARLRSVELSCTLSGATQESRFAAGSGHTLRQIDTERYRLDDVVSEGRSGGAVQLPGAFSACVARYWQRFPKATSVRGDSVMFTLLDDDSEEGTLFAQGEAQTHRLWLSFDAPPAAELEAAVESRPVLRPTAEYLCSTGAFGTLSPKSACSSPAFESAVDEGYVEILRDREERTEYGYRDYGDSRFEMLPDAWLNSEYDWPHVFSLLYARSGRREFLDMAMDTAYHMMDTDIIHYKPAPFEHLTGGAHEHSTGHTAAGVDLGHAWLEGLFEVAALLDDERAREHGVGMAELFARGVDRVSGQRYLDQPGARRPGWGLIALMTAYEYTGESRYLDTAREIVEICRREQLVPPGSWVYPGGGIDDPRFPVGKTFMVALTLEGLMRYHRATADETAKEVFLSGIDWAVDWMWDQDVAGFRYIDTPFDSLQRGPGSSAAHILASLLYASELTGEQRYRYVAVRSFKEWMAAADTRALGPNYLRDLLPILPQLEQEVSYEGAFPLRSVREQRPVHVRRFLFLPDGTGYAAGLFGLLMRSDDRGKSWRRIDTGINTHLYAGAFTSRLDGFFLGEGTELILTSDGGESWSTRRVLDVELRGASIHYFYDLLMEDEKVGYAGGYTIAVKTTDGGKSWSRIWDAIKDGRWNKLPQWRSLCRGPAGSIRVLGSYGLSGMLEHDGVTATTTIPGGGLFICFLDDAVGFATGLDGTIWRTGDSGLHWNTVSEYTGDAFWQVSFFDESIGYACSERGRILRSTDQGRTWESTESGAAGPLRAIHAISASVAVAGGDEGTLLRTEDAGKSWQALPYLLED